MEQTTTGQAYCELFGLTEPPFRLTPDPQFLFASKQHARAKAYMESTIWLADGFVVLTGEIGSGKTTLIECFLDELPENVTLAVISQTQLSPVEFLQAVLVEFGFEPFKMAKVELLAMIKEFLVDQYSQGKKVLLVVDEAQNLSKKVLEEIRLLSGIETKKEKVLRIILAGQPELGDTLDSDRLEQLLQRVRLRFHLGRLSRAETQDYILHRLNIAGAEDREIFTPEALRLVFLYSGGVPRLINILCDTALLCAFADESTLVDEAVIRSAVEELQWTEYEQRLRERESNADPTGQHELASTALAKLELYFGEDLVSDIELRPGRYVIGRTPDNDLRIQSKFVSRHHAQIVADLQQSTIEDLNSTNGMFLGARRVKRHRFSDGDEIQLGEHKLVYRNLRTPREMSGDDTASRRRPENADSQA
ncbi:MAG: AAA family ATPase [Gammaproteobacteria bacterium]|nr:AAA family ATPase [Gammaproteobacteria bacterium]MDH3505616.1 AAA family ATPase [Gammaproteobacteria bacterium]